MYSNTRLWRRPTSLSTGPSLATNEWMLGVVPANKTLAALQKQSIPDNTMNREISFWTEPVVISFAYITAYTILGDDVKINTMSQNAKDIISEFQDHINFGNQTIEDLFTDSYIDNCTQAKSIWRNFVTDDSPVKLDVARLDPTTIITKKNKTAGYQVYIQTARKEMENFYNKKAYYNYWRKKATQATNLSYIVEDVNSHDWEEETKIEAIVIPNEPKYVLEFNFFRRPPTSAILNHMAYKRWILWYMKQYSERFWSPFRKGYVGNPQFYMPEDPEEFKKERDNLLKNLVFMKNFGVVVTPGYNKIEESSTNTARASSIYVDYMNFLNEEMMFAMMGSMGIRSARGTELATSRVLEQGFLRFARGIRGRFDRNLRNFYSGVLLPLNGDRTTRNQIELRHSPMVYESIDKTVKAVRDACECLLFEDWNEPRQILQAVFGNVMDELPPGVAENLREKFIEMNTRAPSPFQATPKPPA